MLAFNWRLICFIWKTINYAFMFLYSTFCCLNDKKWHWIRCVFISEVLLQAVCVQYCVWIHEPPYALMKLKEVTIWSILKVVKIMCRSEAGGNVYWSQSEPITWTVLGVDPKSAYLLFLPMAMVQIIKWSILKVMERMRRSEAGDVRWSQSEPSTWPVLGVDPKSDYLLSMVMVQISKCQILRVVELMHHSEVMLLRRKYFYLVCEFKNVKFVADNFIWKTA